MKRILSLLKIAHFIVIGACLLTGCVEEYEADLPEGETNLLVVNGTIRSNEKASSISQGLFHLIKSPTLMMNTAATIGNLLFTMQELASVEPMVLNTNVQYRITVITPVTPLRWIQTYRTM